MDKIIATFQSHGVAGRLQDNSPTILPLSNGGFILAWRGETEVGLTWDDGFDLFTQYFSSVGSALNNTLRFQGVEGSSNDIGHTLLQMNDHSIALAWWSSVDNRPVNGFFLQELVFSDQDLIPQKKIQIGDSILWQPQLAKASPDSFAVVSWGSGVRVQTLTDDFDLLSDTGFASRERHPNISETLDGYAVAWWESGASGWNVFTQGLDADGNPSSEKHQLSSTSVTPFQQPQLASTSDGGFVVAWHATTDNEQGTDVFFQKLSVTSEPLGSPLALRGMDGVLADRYPDITSLPDGDIILVWQGETTDNSGNDIFVYQASSTESTVFDRSSLTRLSGETGLFDDKDPKVLALDDGGFLVAWSGATADGSSYDIFAQRFNQDGTKHQDSWRLKGAEGNYLDQSPTISSLVDGNVVISWVGETDNDNLNDIFGVLIDMQDGSMSPEQEQYLEIFFPSIIGENGGPGEGGTNPGDPPDDGNPGSPGSIDHWSLEQGRLEGVFVEAGGVTYFLERVLLEDRSKLYFSMENFEGTLSEIEAVYTFERTDIVLAPTSSVSDRSSAVVSEFGSIAWLADWYDLKSVAGFIDTAIISDVLDLREKDNPNIADYQGDKFGNEGPFLLFDGSSLYSSQRSYFVSDHQGTAAFDWLVHDTIADHQIDLGSWTFSRDVLSGINLSANYRIIDGAPLNTPAFDIVLASSSGDVATFEVYATEVADSGDPGLEDLQFVLSHNTADMTIDGASISTATGITAVPNLNQAAGTLTLAGFALPPFTDLNTPVLTFEATILNEETPLTITIDDIFADDTAHPRIEEQFVFSSLEISTTVSDRFGNALPDAVVSAYEVQIGDDLFLREVSSSDTSSVFEIVAKPKEAVSSIDFDLLDNAGLIDFQVGSALSGWSIQSNTNTPDTVSFAGFGAVNGSQDLVAGQETVLATFTTSTDPDFVIDGIFLNTTAQADISVGEVVAVSEVGNVTVHQVARGSDVYLDADKPIDEASDRAITANDALQALRLAVGLTKSDGKAEWHDYIAADINKDGQVTANDALNILKFAVGLTDGPSADWVFVDGDADWSAIGRRDTNYEEGIWLEDVIADMSVNMTGILVGDVNGSYVV